MHSHVRSHWFIPPKQRWLPFEGFVEAEKCFLQCLRPKRWTEVRSDCSKTVTVPLEGKDSKIVISEMVIAGNIIRRRGISVTRAIRAIGLCVLTY